MPQISLTKLAAQVAGSESFMAIVDDVWSRENAAWILDTHQSRKEGQSHFDFQIFEQRVLQGLGCPVLGS